MCVIFVKVVVEVVVFQGTVLLSILINFGVFRTDFYDFKLLGSYNHNYTPTV